MSEPWWEKFSGTLPDAGTISCKFEVLEMGEGFRQLFKPPERLIVEINGKRYSAKWRFNAPANEEATVDLFDMEPLP